MMDEQRMVDVVESCINDLVKSFLATPYWFYAKNVDSNPPHQGMMNKNWVTRVGVGKRAYYSLTARGDAAIKRYEKSGSTKNY